MLKIRKRSGWTYETSSGIGVGVSFAGGGKGQLVMTPPVGGTARFNYKYAGGGYSVGVSKQNGKNVSFATEDMFSVGKLFILDTFRGNELSYQDITGMCMIVELAASAGHGGSFTAMLLGIPPRHFQQELGADLVHFAIVAGYGQHGQTLMELINAKAPAIFQTYSKAVLIMAAANAGGGSAGILGSVGYVSLGSIDQHTIPEKDLPPVDPVKVRQETRRLPTPVPAIDLPGDVLFDFDESDLKKDAVLALRQVAGIIRTYPGGELRVLGHTDSLGKPDYNKALSERRATTVKKWIVSQGLRKDGQVSTEGFGATQPVASNDNPAGREKNRRVEILILGDKHK